MAGGSDQRPAPSATGTLRQRPLAHVLVYARNKRLTGALEVNAPDGRHGKVDLWRGRITDARTLPAVAYFGAVAYELGYIDNATLDATLLEIARTKRLHGEVLLDRGSISRAQRDEILAEQACRKVHHLFTLPPETTFAFYEARPGEEPPLALDPIAPVWRGVRDHPPAESVADVLSRFQSTPLRMVNEGPVARAGLTQEEAAVADALLWRAMTIAQLRAMSKLPTARVDLIAYLLVITKCVEPAPASASSPAMPRVVPSPSGAPAGPLSSIPAPPGSGPLSGRPTIGPVGPASMSPSSNRMPVAPSSGPPPGTPSSSRIPVAPPSQPRPLSSIPATARSVFTPGPPPAHTTSSKMPAVRPPSGSGEIRTSMSFRVPSAPGMTGSGSQRSSSRVPAAPPTATFGPADLGAAGIAHRALAIENEDLFEVLGLPTGATDEAVRAAFFRLARLWHPDRLPPDLAAFRTEAEKIFDHMARAHRTLTDPDARREWLATRVEKERPRKDIVRDIEQALARREFALAEEQARKIANANSEDAEAHALAAWAMTAAGEAPEETLRAAMPLLDKAVLNDRECERAFFYRGVFHKRLGNLAAAFRDFSRVVQITPKHVDAQRELRILEMRARKGSGEHALEALIKGKKK